MWIFFNVIAILINTGTYFEQIFIAIIFNDNFIFCIELIQFDLLSIVIKQKIINYC